MNSISGTFIHVLTELGQNIAQLEERCSKLTGDNSELEAAVDRLRTALSQMDQTKKDLQHKASKTIYLVSGHLVPDTCLNLRCCSLHLLSILAVGLQ